MPTASSRTRHKPSNKSPEVATLTDLARIVEILFNLRGNGGIVEDRIGHLACDLSIHRWPRQ